MPSENVGLSIFGLVHHFGSTSMYTALRPTETFHIYFALQVL